MDQLHNEGRLAEAAEKARALAELIRRTVGDRHPSYANVLNNLGSLLTRQGDDAGAQAVYDQLAAAKEALGERDGVYVLAVSQAAGALARQGKDAEARAAFLRALGTLKASVGDRHPAYADMLGKQALFQRDQGDLAGARAGLERAVELLAAALGEGHPATTGTLKELAQLLASLGKVGEARAAYQRVASVVKVTSGERHPAYADALNDLAGFLMAQGRTADAKPLLEEVLAIRKESLGEGHPGYAEGLSNLAMLFKEQANFAAALPLQERSVAVVKASLGDRNPSYATALNNLAELLRLKGDYVEAKRLHERVLSIRKESLGERSLEYAESLSNLALVLTGQGDYAAALPLMERAVTITRELLGPKSQGYAVAVNNLAVLRLDQGDDVGARRLFEEALSIRKEILGPKHPDYAASLSDLGSLYQAQGNLILARPLLEQAIAIRKEVLGESHPDYIMSLNNLAMLMQDQGDYISARPLLERALRVCREQLGDNHPQTALCINNLAALCFEEGDYAAARPLLEGALAAIKASRGERSVDYARALCNLAELSPSAAARPLLEQARGLYETTLGKRSPGYSSVLEKLGRLAWGGADLPSARSLFEQARSAARDTYGEHHYLYAVALHTLGSFLVETGEGEAARSLLEQALAISTEVSGENSLYTSEYLGALAMAYRLVGRPAEAQSALQKAMEIDRRFLDLAARSRSQRQQLEFTRTLRTTLDLYLSFALDASQPAEPAYREVLAWKGAVLGRQHRDRLLRRSLRPERRAEVERSAADLQEITNRLAALALSKPDFDAPAKWKRRVADLGNEKDRLEGRLAELGAATLSGQVGTPADLDRIRAALLTDVVLVDFLLYRHISPPSPGKKEWKREDRVVAFVVRTGRPVVTVTLGPVNEIRDEVEAWRVAAGTGSNTDPPEKDPISSKATPAAASSDDVSAGESLRRRIWLPIESHLGDARTVLVSPDDALARLPLGALPGKESGHFLIEERAFAVVPVPRLLPELLQGQKAEGATTRPDRGAGLLAVGDIDYDGAPSDGATSGGVPGVGSLRFARLEATGAEVVAVRDRFARQFPGEPARLLKGGEATVAAFVRDAPESRWVHLATHGYFAPPSLRSALNSSPDDSWKPASRTDAIDPFGGRGVSGFHPGLLSGLALAGANRPTETGRNDGILTALQVAAIDLSGVELVTLSACETGLGRSAGGEGLLGLQRAFQEAGAGSTVASLWAVSDTATKALMERFYVNLWEKRQTKLQALNEAQLWMLREGRARRPELDRQARGVERLDIDIPPRDGSLRRLPPYFWAAFVLSGDWR